MDNPAQPRPALPGPRDLYVMPCAAEAFAGIVVGQGRLPVRLHFSLADGREFHLPISNIALRQLASALAAALRSTQERIPDRGVRENGLRAVETPVTGVAALRPK
jgi:hypothetical protein